MNGTEPQQLITNITNKITELNIPIPVYVSIASFDHTIQIYIMGKEPVTLQYNSPEDLKIQLLKWLDQQEVKENYKYIAAEIAADQSDKPIISDFWLKQDIVPFFVPISKPFNTELQKDAVRVLRKRFNELNLINIQVSKLNEVEIAEFVTSDDYKSISDPNEFQLLLQLAEEWKEKRIVFINATPQGGGVALMRHALIRLFRLLGVDAHWHVMYPQKEAFDITKLKFHNVLQAVAAPDTVLTVADKKVYDDWIASNASQLEVVYKQADVIVIDDPQPSGLIPYIRKTNPKAKIIYRSHIQIESHLADIPGTPQQITWQFIWDRINSADLFVSHPMKQFIPQNVPQKTTLMMPATTDALDGLNKPLSDKHIDYYMKWFNRLLLETNQTPLDRSRPYFIQIARFDPSKGIPDVIEAYRLFIEKLQGNFTHPQLVICGHGSIDDPDGVPLYTYTMELLKQEKYVAIARDIKVARLPASDQLLNALLREAKVAFQLSHKEGFEVKVTEALMKGVPVIAYKAGGIPLQVIEGVSGYLVEIGDTQTVAQKLYNLYTNEKLYAEMRKGALEHINPETTTISNAVNWLFLANELVKNGKILGNGRNVKELIKEKYE